MKEIRDIVRAYDQAQENQWQTALATLVTVEGSSYRRQGTRMLMNENGSFAGSISGSCLEGEALRKAQLVMATKKAMLVTYDANDEGDGLGLDLGCNGVVRILIEPIIEDKPYNPMQLLRQLVADPKGGALATVFSQDMHGTHAGTGLLQLKSGEVFCGMSDAALADNLITGTKLAIANKTFINTSYHVSQGGYAAFIDYIPPAVSLIIVGAGNDSIPLAGFANVAGWDAIVIDDRPEYATARRFPTAQKVIVAKPGKILSLEKIPSLMHFNEHTVVVLMTHNYSYDLAALEQLLTTEIPYIGVLGPHKRQQMLLRDLQEKGVVIGESKQSRIFCPAGLGIGADTPEKIALSVIAEIKKVLACGCGTSVKEKKSPIREWQPEVAA
jgi:xanthine dehydrogenase accessory factor